MSEGLLDLDNLPGDVREKLAELDLELSEGGLNNNYSIFITFGILNNRNETLFLLNKNERARHKSIDNKSTFK